MNNKNREITFTQDIYNKPKLLGEKDTLVQTILQALFLVPGNLPSMPDVGVNIEQYLYKSVDIIDESKIASDIEYSCGRMLGETQLSDVKFTTMETPEGPVFILSLNVTVSEEENKLLIGVQKRNEVVSFNHKFVNIKELE